MRKTRNLPGTVRRPSINAQTSGRFTFTRNRAKKISLEHETTPQSNFILRPIAADARLTRFRHSKRSRIRSLLLQLRPPELFVMHLNPGKRSTLVGMQVLDRFWTKAKVRSRSTDKTSR